MTDAFLPFDLLQDGIGRMARNLCQTLHLAGEPVTVETAINLVKTLPKDRDDIFSKGWRESSYLSHCLQKAYERSGGNAEVKELVEYFADNFVSRPRLSREAIRGSLLATLTEIDAAMKQPRS